MTLPELNNPRTPVYIVGGGPSLENFPWELLRGRFTIAINRAYEVLPEAPIVYFSDARIWVSWYGSDLAKHPGIKVALNNTGLPDEVLKFRATGREGIDLAPGCLRHGNNSGYAALNIALHCGARNIYLLGFDMKKNPEGKHNWHSGYRTPQRPDVYEKMTPFFPTLRKPLVKLGVRVVNVVGPEGSALDIFPTMTLDTLKQELEAVETEVAAGGC